MNRYQVVGLDIGYGFTKAASATNTVIFPSLTGSPDRSQFGIDQDNHDLFLTLDWREYAIGETAIRFSRFVSRLESRRWIESKEWLALALAALEKVDASGTIRVVVGLPLSYFNDKETVQNRLLGKHTINTSNGQGYKQRMINIADVVVVPQPFGSLFRTVFLPNGNMREDFMPLLKEQVGIIDFGSNHTNLLEVNGGRQVEAGSTAIDMGGWDLCRAARDYLLQKAPGAEFKDHDLAKAIEDGHYEYFGESIELEPIIAPMRSDLVNQVTATATQLWGDGANLWAILVTGGLSVVVGKEVKAFFNRHKRVIVVNEPQLANARGFYSYGKFLNQYG